MINGTSMLGKQKPRWPIGNATETMRVPDAGPPTADTWVRSVATVTSAFFDATAFVVDWLADLPHRVGGQLFASNDEEARWRGWQVTELACGLARQYRDPRFDTPRDESGAHGGGVQAGQDPRTGAAQQSWLGGFIPGIPEAWDDHWDGVFPKNDPRDRTEAAEPSPPPRDGEDWRDGED